MYMTDSLIAAIDFNTTVTSQGVSSAFVPILGLSSPADFDYDSHDGFVYWTEFDFETGKVTIKFKTYMY